jgi:hypothetical protein
MRAIPRERFSKEVEILQRYNDQARPVPLASASTDVDSLLHLPSSESDAMPGADADGLTPRTDVFPEFSLFSLFFWCAAGEML